MGRPVVAPTDGDVFAAVDGHPDSGGANLSNPAGNHVVIRRSPGQFVFVAHLQLGTVAVAPGTRVTAGQFIGRCGNSGNSSLPHVHFHMQSTGGVLDYSATALPMVFDQVVAWDFGRNLCVTTAGAALTRGMFLC
jgi:murein DD-endopeptidase MepM/ murein hydrolase activator NlpD